MTTVGNIWVFGCRGFQDRSPTQAKRDAIRSHAILKSWMAGWLKLRVMKRTRGCGVAEALIEEPFRAQAVVLEWIGGWGEVVRGPGPCHLSTSPTTSVACICPVSCPLFPSCLMRPPPPPPPLGASYTLGTRCQQSKCWVGTAKPRPSKQSLGKGDALSQ